MSNVTPVLMINVDDVIYPVAMTKEQVSAFNVFISALSQDGELNVIGEMPIVRASELKEKFEDVKANLRKGKGAVEDGQGKDA